MNIYSLSSCCGIGEIVDLKLVSFYDVERAKYSLAVKNNDIDYLVAAIIKERDHRTSKGIYPVVIATTPDTDDYWGFHIALALAGFIPVAAGESFHKAKPKYKNILWIFQRNEND